MRVKRFMGDNVAEAMGKVKRELGLEAVILQTREVKEGGFLGFFAKSKVEITAAIEEKPLAKKEGTYLAGQGLARYQTNTSGYDNQEFVTRDDPDRHVNFSERMTGGATAAGTDGLQQELQNMRQMLEKMDKHMETEKAIKSGWPPELQKWAEYLLERGLTQNLVREQLCGVQQALPEAKWLSNQAVLAHLKENVEKLCRVTEPIRAGVNKPQVVALIGPTGVGKTTTIGKLAAGFSIVDKRRVALITADTYRVAAVEQIKTFGEIIGVPVDVVMTPSALRDALLKHKDKELIFVDTAGRSPQHDLHMSELRAFLEKGQPNMTMLVMSATTQDADQLRVLQRFEPLATHLIFTKLDETTRPGSILNLLQHTSLPVSYITNGQNVPDDIELATPESLTRASVGGGIQDA